MPGYPSPELHGSQETPRRHRSLPVSEGPNLRVYPAHTQKKLNAGLLVALWLCLITTDEIFILSKSQNILEAAVLSLQGQTLAAVLLSHGLHHHPICKFAKNI